ncbi:transmembrane proteinB [Arachis hypogaea]|nr:transmembrane proteinB [Arachis hypogaea]
MDRIRNRIGENQFEPADFCEKSEGRQSFAFTLSLSLSLSIELNGRTLAAAHRAFTATALSPPRCRASRRAPRVVLLRSGLPSLLCFGVSSLLCVPSAVSPWLLFSVEQRPIRLLLASQSFIKFESVVFTHPKFFAVKNGYMQQNTNLVEAIVLKVKDCLRIGESHLKSELICHTKKLSDSHFYNLGKVIIYLEREERGNENIFVI